MTHTSQLALTPPSDAEPSLREGTFREWQSDYFPRSTPAQLALIAILAGMFFIVGRVSVGSPNLWKHLSAGQELVGGKEAGASAAEFLERAQQSSAWLSEGASYAVVRSLGYDGIALARTMLVVLAWLVVGLIASQRGGARLGIAGLIAAGFLLTLPMLPELGPILWATPLFVLLLAGCQGWRMVDGGFDLMATNLSIASSAFSSHPPSAIRHSPFRSLLSLILIVGLFAIWANLGSSFLLGLVVLSIGILSLKQKKSVALIFSAALAGCCLQPHGIWIFADGFDTTLRAAIAQWASRDLTSFAICSSIMIVATLILGMVVRRRNYRVRPRDITLLVVLGIAVLLHGEWLLWWSIAWTWTLIQLPGTTTPRTLRFPADATTMRTLLAMTVVFTMILLTPCSVALLANHPRGDAEVLDRELPLYLAEELNRRDVTGPTMVPGEWAAFLDWQTEGSIEPLPVVGSDRETTETCSIHYFALSHREHSDLRDKILLDSHSRIRYQDQQSILIECLP